MLLYKLKKIFREKWMEIVRASFALSFIASFISFFPFIFILRDDFNKSEKRSMFITSAICVSINLFIIYLTDYFFGFNIIFSLTLSTFFSFLLYFIPCLLLLVLFEISELQLNKDEVREAKLDTLFRKLF